MVEFLCVFFGSIGMEWPIPSTGDCPSEVEFLCVFFGSIGMEWPSWVFIHRYWRLSKRWSKRSYDTTCIICLWLFWEWFLHFFYNTYLQQARALLCDLCNVVYISNSDRILVYLFWVPYEILPSYAFIHRYWILSKWWAKWSYIPRYDTMYMHNMFSLTHNSS